MCAPAAAAPAVVAAAVAPAAMAAELVRSSSTSTCRVPAPAVGGSNVELVRERSVAHGERGSIEEALLGLGEH